MSIDKKLELLFGEDYETAYEFYDSLRDEIAAELLNRDLAIKKVSAAVLYLLVTDKKPRDAALVLALLSTPLEPFDKIAKSAGYSVKQAAHLACQRLAEKIPFVGDLMKVRKKYLNDLSLDGKRRFVPLKYERAESLTREED